MSLFIEKWEFSRVPVKIGTEHSVLVYITISEDIKHIIDVDSCTLR